MRYLFISPKDAPKGGFYSFPLGMALVSANMKKHSFDVECLNLNHSDEAIDIQIANKIAGDNIDVVCTGGMSVHFHQLNAILKAAKKAKPNVLTIVGGPIMTCDPKLALDNMEIDIGIAEEGEITMPELAACLDGNIDFRGVAGICFRGEHGVVSNPSRGAIDKLDDLPFPDYEGFEYEEFIKTVYPNSSDIYQTLDEVRPGVIITSRSCPFSCTFCYHPLGKKYRQRSLDNVFEEIEFLIGKYQINFLHLWDELFSVNKSRMLEFAERISVYNIQWEAQLRVNDVDLPTLQALKRSGMNCVSYGIESVNDNILKSMKKKTDKERIEKALAATREAKLALIGNLLIGDPEDTVESVKEQIKWKFDHRHIPLVFAFIRVIPDSPIYQDAVKSGKITDKYDFLKRGFPFLNITKMSDAEYFYFLDKTINLNRYDERYFTVGASFDSKMAGFADDGGLLFEFSSKCPECGSVNQYKNFKEQTSEKFFTLMCRECGFRYQAKTIEVYATSFGFLEALKFRFAHGFLYYYNANYGVKLFLRKNPSLHNVVKKFILWLKK
jgi:anaerobic magnesium-protoporphyrin IX monomethyl ester cyclase